MEIFAVTAIITLFTFLNSSNFLIGLLTSRKGEFFLGTVHWPADYFYYLAQFAQGKYSWLAGYNLYTSDYFKKTYIYAVNVFLGHIYHLLGINQIWAYQISVALFTILFLALSYILIKEIFPLSRTKRLLAFFLFNISNAFPRIAFGSGKWEFYYYDYWFNNGLPFNRLVGVPHQMIGKSMLVLVLLLAIWWMKGKRSIWVLIGLALSSILLASVEPVHWGLVVLVLCVVFTAYLFYQSPARMRLFSERFSLALPGLIFFLSGLPVALYLKNLLSHLPFSQLVDWEIAQYRYISVSTFLLSTGPVIIWAGLGLWSFFKKINFAKILLGIFSVICLILFFSPVSASVKVVNVRFLPVVFFLFLSVLSSEAIYNLSQKTGKYAKITLFISVVITFLVVLPGWMVQLPKRLTMDKANAYYFVPNTVIDAFQKAEKVAISSDTFLVTWPFNVSFPAITGSRTYEGHHLFTIDPATKDKMLFDFFDGKMSEDQLRRFLKDNGITYVVAYPWNTVVKSNLFGKVYENDYLGVYRVNSY